MNLCRTKIRQPKKPYACGIATPIKHCQKGEDREEKYQERKKKDIAVMKEIEESVKNIEDPELRLKKKLELMRLKQVEKFMGEDVDQGEDQKE